MTGYPPPTQPIPQPSLTPPILMTAFFTAILFSLPSLMGQSPDLTCCLHNCCASVVASSAGMMPLMTFRRSGGLLTPGVGCLVGFLGVGMGGLVGAIVQAQFPPYEVSDLRDILGQGYAEMEAQMAQSGQSVEVSREDFVRNSVAMAPYSVIMFVAFSAFVAGGIGLILGARRGRPPQYPHPPQQPPAPPAG